MEGEQSDHTDEQLIDDSRRSFMKKGALASGALALGVTGSGGATEASLQQQPSQTLMFAYDYQPTQSLQVIARLQQSVVRQILGQPVGDDGNPVVSDTSEWNAYLANYQMQGNVPGEFVLLFTRGGQLQDQVQLGTSATFFNDQINLLEVSLGGGGGGGGG